MDAQIVLLIVAALTFPLVPAYFLTLQMSRPEKMIHNLSPSELDQCNWRIQQHQSWLASVNLQFLTAFRFGSIKALVYKQYNAPRYFTFHFHEARCTFGVQSYFQDGKAVETATSGDTGMHPLPGLYKQSFPGLSPEEAWRRHLEGEAHFINIHGFVHTPLTTEFKQALCDEIRATMRYTRSQPFWPFRQYYRFFVTRHRLRNRSVAELYPLKSGPAVAHP
ncbi:MAG TPA: hypothetical protein VM680_06105 [Verrucomicrobiae bacterium]|nr:hypothetical protein [Verrucomicrobiae bacterium]